MMGTLEKFSLKSLSSMDGERIAIAFEQALKRVVQDCDPTQELIKIAPVGDCIDDAYMVCSRTIVADLKQKLPEALVICQ